MTTFDPFLAAVENYLPAITVLGIIWKAYHGAKKSVTKWANTLLDNHAHHVQASLDRQEDLLKTISNQQDLQLSVLERIADK